MDAGVNISDIVKWEYLYTAEDAGSLGSKVVGRNEKVNRCVGKANGPMCLSKPDNFEQ